MYFVNAAMMRAFMTGESVGAAGVIVIDDIVG
jgi:hypothetical protein